MATDINPRPAEDSQLDLERECETWDWARTAGVSADELRQALCAPRSPAPGSSAEPPSR